VRSACLAILNYNGVRHLEFLLPTLPAAIAGSKGPTPVVVLDNRSTEPDPAWLAEHAPQVDVVVAPKNDYLYSYNDFLATRTEDVVVLLNNDLRLAPGFLPALLRHFDHGDVFSVGATSRDWDDTCFTCGPARLQSHHGVYHWDWERDRQQLSPTLFTSGGFMAVDRRRFLELGGFNRLFYPGYGEDLDLCFRAWRRGWRCLFEPDALVYHRENGTFSARAQRLMERSQWLFQWSSLPPAAGVLESTAMTALTALRRLGSGDPGWLLRRAQIKSEWRKVQYSHRASQTSSAELDALRQRLHASPPPPPTASA
jgi:N-acetylglucosaminyl-diphospho-decaprenol L-rhamnosyltransferase